MSGSIRIDRGWLDEALADLVAIDSVNPTLIPGAAGERAIGAHVAGVMRAIGMEVTVLEETSGRPSVVGVLRGAGGGPSLMLNAHVDTVGVQGMRDPHRPRAGPSSTLTWAASGKPWSCSMRSPAASTMPDGCSGWECRARAAAICAS